jgi:predicted nucleic acid-binding protein
VIVLDASVLIGHLDTGDAHHDAAGDLLAEHIADEFLVSVMTRAEVLIGPARRSRRRTVEDALDQLGIRTVALDVDAAAPLAELRAATGLPLPDCCVVHAAEITGAAIATFDHRLAQVATRRGITVHPESSGTNTA